MIDLSTFRDSLEELEKTRERAVSPEVGADPELFSMLRTASIKCFEFTYELSYKFMRRFLDAYGPSKAEEEGEYIFRTLLRLSFEHGLITGIDPWIRFLDNRNITSHTYDRAKADIVFSIIPDFLTEARFLLKALEKKTKDAP